jgi:hypothetical protein
MLRLSYLSEYKGKVETLKFKQKILSTGWHTDVNGQQWDVHAIIYGKILARPIHITDFRYSTGTDAEPSSYRTRWKPYNVQVVN